MSYKANIQRLTKHFDGLLGRSGGCLGEFLGYPVDGELRYGTYAVGRGGCCCYGWGWGVLSIECGGV
jgi:hypothetical protein